MPSAFKARAKPFAALTFMDGFLLASSYRDAPALSRSTVVSLRDPDGLPSRFGEERAHEPSSRPVGPGPDPRLDRHAGALARGSAIPDDVGGAHLAVSRLVRSRGAHRDHHDHDGPLRRARRDGEADARQP